MLLLAPVLALSAAPLAPAETNDATRLLPPGATIVVRVDSLGGLLSLANEFVKATDPEAEELGLTDVMREPMGMPGDAAHIDDSRPVWVALAIGINGVEPTYAVPTSDAGAYVASLPDGFFGSPLGDYVGVARSAITPSAEPHETAAALGSALVSSRIEIGSLIEAFRPVIEPGLDQMEMMMDSMLAEQDTGFDMEAMTELYVDWAWAFIDSADTIDLSFDHQGDLMAVNASLGVLPKSPMEGVGTAGAPVGADLMKWIDPKDPIAFAMNGDWNRMLEMTAPLMESVYEMYPENMREMVEQATSAQMELAGLIGHQAAGGGTFAADGMRMSYFFEVEDSAGFLTKAEEVMGGMSSEALTVTSLGRSDFEGREVVRYRVKIDSAAFASLMEEMPESEQETFVQMMDAMLGEDGLATTIAPVEGGAVFVIGGDDEFVRQSLSPKPVQPPADMAYALRKMGAGDPALVYRIDLFHLIQEMAPLFEQMEGGEEFELPPDLKGSSLPYTVWMALDESSWRSGLVFGREALQWLSQMR